MKSPLRVLITFLVFLNWALVIKENWQSGLDALIPSISLNVSCWINGSPPKISTSLRKGNILLGPSFQIKPSSWSPLGCCQTSHMTHSRLHWPLSLRSSLLGGEFWWVLSSIWGDRCENSLWQFRFLMRLLHVLMSPPKNSWRSFFIFSPFQTSSRLCWQVPKSAPKW